MYFQAMSSHKVDANVYMFYKPLSGFICAENTEHVNTVILFVSC